MSRPSSVAAGVARLLAPVAAVVSCGLAASWATAQDGASPGGGDGGQGPLAPQPLTVQVEPEPALEHDADAVAVLDATEAAINALQSVRATITCMGTGVFKDTAERGTVQVIGRRMVEDPTRWRYRISGPITPQRAREPIDIDATFEGARVRYTDREERAIGARALPSRVSRPWFEAPVLIFEERLWLTRLPFEKIRAAVRMKLEARETIDGVECNVIRADMTGGVEYYLIYVGVEDNLPRRHRRGFDSRNIPGGLPMTGYEQTDYARIEIDPEIPDGAFVLAAPEGWRDERFPGDDLVPGAVNPATLSSSGRFEETGEEGATPQGGGDDEASLALAEASGTVPASMPAAMTMALDFELEDRAGQKVRLSDLRGRPVVLVFWGGWSPWAREALAAVAPAVGEHEGVRLLVLSVRDRTREAAAERHQQQGAPGTLLPGGDEVAVRYEVAAVPTVIVVGPSGEVRLRHAGLSADLGERVRGALGEP